MHNRNWHAKPHQGGSRSNSDYGSTRLGKTHKTWLCEYSNDFKPHELPRRSWWIGPMLFGVFLGGLFVACLPAVPV